MKLRIVAYDVRNDRQKVTDEFKLFRGGKINVSHKRKAINAGDIVHGFAKESALNACAASMNSVHSGVKGNGSPQRVSEVTERLSFFLVVTGEEWALLP